MHKKNKVNELKIKNFILLIIAGFINAFGVSQVFSNYLTLSLCLVILNIPLFLYGLKKQGKAFTIYSIFAVCIYSLGAWLINDVLSIDVSIASPLA